MAKLFGGKLKRFLKVVRLKEKIFRKSKITFAFFIYYLLLEIIQYLDLKVDSQGRADVLNEDPLGDSVDETSLAHRCVTSKNNLKNI